MNPTPIHPKLAEITERIIERSRPTREKYLAKIRSAKQMGRLERNQLGCSNLAHGYASMPKSIKIEMLQDTVPNLGIITAYNDMVSAHQPFKDFPDLIKKGHIYILQTPLFRVRNKKETLYCYSEEERKQALSKLGANPEITRFKGLGEIDPDEFKTFIGKNMRLDKVTLRKEDAVSDMLKFYMGKNTQERQDFIVNNLNVEVE